MSATTLHVLSFAHEKGLDSGQPLSLNRYYKGIMHFQVQLKSNKQYNECPHWVQLGTRIPQW